MARKVSYLRKMRGLATESLRKFQQLTRWQLWGRGELSWYLKPGQRAIYDLYKRHKGEGIIVFNVSRQAGKSTTSLLICFEECLKNRNHKVIYAAPEKSQADGIFLQNSAELLDSCPPHLRPKANKVTKTFEFPNGSTIHIIGLDNPQHRRRVRGKSANLVVLDEAAFMSNLEEIIKSIIIPMFNFTNAGIPRILVPTTPNDEPGHYFEALAANAQREDRYVTIDIYNFKTPEEVEQIMEAYHLKDPAGNIIIHASEDPKFKREYLCSFTARDDRLVVPTWQDVKSWSIMSTLDYDETEQKQNEVKFGFPIDRYNRPAVFDPIVVSDYGWTDHTGILFGYIDHDNNWLVVEDELFFKNKLPAEMAWEILNRARTLWPSIDPATISMHCETGARGEDRLAQIRKDTGLRFRKVNISDKEALYGSFNQLVSNSKFKVMDNCIHLLNTLEKAEWVFDRMGKKKKPLDMIRTEELGHCDMLDAALILNNVARWGRLAAKPEIPNANDRLVSAQLQQQMKKRDNSAQWGKLKGR